MQPLVGTSKGCVESIEVPFLHKPRITLPPVLSVSANPGGQ